MTQIRFGRIPEHRPEVGYTPFKTKPPLYSGQILFMGRTMDDIAQKRAHVETAYQSRKADITRFFNREIVNIFGIQYTGRRLLLDIVNSTAKISTDHSYLIPPFTLFYLIAPKTKTAYYAISIKELHTQLGKEHKAAIKQAVKDMLDCGLVKSIGMTSIPRHKLGLLGGGVIQVTELGFNALRQPLPAPTDADTQPPLDKPASKSEKSLD